MKRISRIAFLLVFSGLIVIGISSCKKRKEFKNETGQVSDDNSNITSSIDGSVNDVNATIAKDGNMNGRLASPAKYLSDTVCGATVDATLHAQGIITLTFDGSVDCNGRKRSGTIKATLQDYATGKRWKDVGAVLRLDYTDYKVVRTSDNKSLTFNGSHTITNVSGGNSVLLILNLQQTVVHQVDGSNINVKFDDGKTAVCNISRKYTHTVTRTPQWIYTITGEGTGSHNGLNNIENWGTTRDGDDFTSQVQQAVVWNTTCTPSKPKSGKMEIKVAAKDFSFITTFGVDAGGNQVSSGCPWGFKVEWSYKNKTKDKLYPY